LLSAVKNLGGAGRRATREVSECLSAAKNLDG